MKDDKKFIPFVYIPREIYEININPPFQIKWRDSEDQQQYI